MDSSLMDDSHASIQQQLKLYLDTSPGDEVQRSQILRDLVFLYESRQEDINREQQRKGTLAELEVFLVSCRSIREQQQNSLSYDFPMLRVLIEEHPPRWDRLPDALKTSWRYCTSQLAVYLPPASFHWLVLQSETNDDTSVLQNNRDFWLHYIEALQRCYDDCGDDNAHQTASLLFTRDLQGAPRHIQTDGSLMARACATVVDPKILLTGLLLDLWHNHRFVTELFQANALHLCRMPKDCQKQYPELVVYAINCFERTQQDVTALFLGIDSELWNHRRVVEAWFNAGLPFHKKFPRRFRCDPAIFLMLAEHGRINSPSCGSIGHVFLKSFSLASQSLLRDKTFMTKAIELDSFLWTFASYDIIYDYDLLLLAFSGSEANIQYFDDLLARSSHHKKRDLIPRFYVNVQKKLRIHEDFSTAVLPGMTLARQRSLLFRLNQGTETAHTFGKLVAEYVGVPIGKELRLLRQCALNLQGRIGF